MKSRSALILLGSLLFGAASPAGEVTLRSGPVRVPLLELFTSEGCSSCPPAERWLSTLRASPKLWKDVVPVAFHVDYWDSLGWKDPYAARAYSDRQRQYSARWGSNSVYTPGFVLNGAEWRGRDLGTIPPETKNTGLLTAVIRDGGDVQITWAPAAKIAAKWQAHAVLLGLGVQTDVKAGENGGRKLVHDFVALRHETAAMNKDAGGNYTAPLKLPAGAPRGQNAVAVWVVEEGRTEPAQATGGGL